MVAVLDIPTFGTGQAMGTKPVAASPPALLSANAGTRRRTGPRKKMSGMQKADDAAHRGNPGHSLLPQQTRWTRTSEQSRATE